MTSQSNTYYITSKPIPYCEVDTLYSSLNLYLLNSFFRRFLGHCLRYSLFVYRLIVATLIGIFLMIPYEIKIESFAKRCHMGTLGGKGQLITRIQLYHACCIITSKFNTCVSLIFMVPHRCISYNLKIKLRCFCFYLEAINAH